MRGPRRCHGARGVVDEARELEAADPLAAHLEDIVVVAAEQDVEQAAVPQPADVAVGVDEVAVPAVGDPLDDPRERERCGRPQDVGRDLTQLACQQVLDLRLQVVRRPGRAGPAPVLRPAGIPVPPVVVVPRPEEPHLPTVLARARGRRIAGRPGRRGEGGGAGTTTVGR